MKKLVSALIFCLCMTFTEAQTITKYEFDSKNQHSVEINFVHTARIQELSQTDGLPKLKGSGKYTRQLEIENKSSKDSMEIIGFDIPVMAWITVDPSGERSRSIIAPGDKKLLTITLHALCNNCHIVKCFFIHLNGQKPDIPVTIVADIDAAYHVNRDNTSNFGIHANSTNIH